MRFLHFALALALCALTSCVSTSISVPFSVEQQAGQGMLALEVMNNPLQLAGTEFKWKLLEFRNEHTRQNYSLPAQQSVDGKSFMFVGNLPPGEYRLLWLISESIDLVVFDRKEPVPFPTFRIRAGQLTKADTLVVFRFEDRMDYFRRDWKAVGLTLDEDRLLPFLDQQLAATRKSRLPLNPAPWVDNKAYRDMLEICRLCWRSGTSFPACIDKAN
ncbi:hypothetical protein [Viridibacterium curvum]|uniref:Lipoprotein n=1 Tax=Viridibacterium curvum TaxID=1101404 RepID=A0ABP9QTE1_9RHOO